MSTVRIGVLGCGNVGSAFVPLVAARAKEIEARTGVHLEVTKVAVRNLSRHRDLDIGGAELTNDPVAIVEDPDIDLVVEVIGGIEPARELISTALGRGKPVVTANKELLANVGVELFTLADECGVDLLFEAAVAGGIPIVRALRESLRGEPITPRDGHRQRHHQLHPHEDDRPRRRLRRRARRGAATGLRRARPDGRRRGLRRRRQGGDHGVDRVRLEGRRRRTSTTRASATSPSADIEVARRLGYVVKLLAIIDLEGDGGEVAVRVHPAMVPVAPPSGERARQLQRRVRRGRRRRLADVLRARRRRSADRERGARRRHRRRAQPHARARTASLGTFAKAQIRPIDSTMSEYLLGLEVADEPGVLHAVTGVLADHGVSIRAAEQEGLGPDARLVFITHRGPGVGRAGDRAAAARAAVGAQRRQPAPRRRRMMFRPRSRRSKRSLRSVEQLERLRRTQPLAAASKLALCRRTRGLPPPGPPDGDVPRQESPTVSARSATHESRRLSRHQVDEVRLDAWHGADARLRRRAPVGPGQRRRAVRARVVAVAPRRRRARAAPAPTPTRPPP